MLPFCYSFVVLPQKIIFCFLGLHFVKGDIGEGQSVTVTSTAPIMKCSGSKNVTASFTGTPKKSWTRVETSGQGTTDNYGLSAVLTPGVWEGTATFSCALA